MNDAPLGRTDDATQPYLRLADELRRLGQRLDAIGDELLRLPGAGALARPAGGRHPGPAGPVDGPDAGPVSAPTSGLFAPGQFAPGPISPGQFAPGTFTPGQFTPGTVVPGTVAPGTFPPGTFPPGTFPPRTFPPGTFPPGADPAGDVPAGPIPGAGPVPGGYPNPGYGYQPAGHPPGGHSIPPVSRGMRRSPLFPPITALSGARLLAWTGGAVTLLGVVLLLVLAASRGWFSPAARIGAGAALGVVLIGVGGWLHRRESARTGAVALAATGFVTLHLVLAAATAIYDYLQPVPALVLALLVAGGGLGLADRWRNRLLAGGVVTAAALLAPALVTGWLLVALVLALQIAAAPVVLRRRWPSLLVLAAAGPVLFGVALPVLDQDGTRPAGIATALGVLVVGLGTAAAATRTLPARAVAVLVAVVPVPLIATGVVLGSWSGAALCAVAAVGTALLAARVGTDRRIRLVAATVAALALFQATAIALDGATGTAVVLGQAVVAAVLAYLLRNRFALVVGLAYGAVGVARAAAADAPLAALLEFPRYPYTEPGMVAALLVGAGVSLLVGVWGVALLVAGGRVGWVRPDAPSAGLWVPIGLVGLYGTTSLVVTLALLVAPDRAGFTAGHALVTVAWTMVALTLLARGISRPALRVTGLVLVAAAVAKLVLFDLVALDGIARVAAFLGAGLVLLAAGTRYARLVAEAAASPARADRSAAPPLG